jgi:hypothetical protein
MRPKTQNAGYFDSMQKIAFSENDFPMAYHPCGRA